MNKYNKKNSASYVHIFFFYVIERIIVKIQCERRKILKVYINKYNNKILEIKFKIYNNNNLCC